MRPLSLIALAAVAFVLAGCSMGGSTQTTTVTVTHTVTSSASGPKQPLPGQAETDSVKYFGIPVSMTEVGTDVYALRIKPEYFLVGVTANTAFAAGNGSDCEPLACPGVADDRWVIPAGTQDLQFLVPAATKGTVLDLSSVPTTITAAELASLISGRTKPKLPLESGLWLQVNVDTVTRFAQQFQP
jgi:hypothetical protein